MIVLLAQYVYLFKYVHKSSYKLYQCNPYDSLILLIYNMCILVVSFSLFYCIECCSLRLQMCPKRNCVLILFWTAFPGDAPNWPFVWYTCHLGTFCTCAVVPEFPFEGPVPHHGTDAFQVPGSGRMYPTKGACQQWAHRPIETAVMTTATAPGEPPVLQFCWLVIH